MSYICTVCGISYRVDLNIPDDLWKRISQIRGGSGLLCGSCIMKHIESMSGYDHWNLNKEKEVRRVYKEKEKKVASPMAD